jgi:ribosomal protein L21E
MDNELKNFQVGDRVKIVALPAYVKTAEPMPMLRSPDALAIGEAGTILDRRPGGYYGIRFVQGAFLLESQYLNLIENQQLDN